MNTNILIAVILFLGGIFFSCEKTPVYKNQGDAEWVKVIADSNVYYTGKIRADSHNNLFCSYNHKDYQVDDYSAIIKLDPNGNILWRREFTDLTIYDFVVTPQGNVVIASYSDGITITELNGRGADSLYWSYPLPLPLASNIPILSMKIFITANNNYNISGSFRYTPFPGTAKQCAGFMVEVSPSGNQIWLPKTYIFPNPPAAESAITTITGCVADGTGYLLFGNTQENTPFTSEFFILKTDEKGAESWRNFHQTSFINDDGSYSGYYCNTSDMISSGDGNFYACAFNEKYNLPNIGNVPIYNNDDNSARIYKIDSNGNRIDSVRVKYNVQNMTADLVLTEDNGLMIGFNPFKLAGVYYAGKQSSFVAHLNPALSIQSVSNIQTHYFDYLGSVCAMPDGHYAIETMIQSFGNPSYKLEVIKTDINGNF